MAGSKISRTTIRYFAAHAGRFGKEDIGFENDRSEVTGLQMMTFSGGLYPQPGGELPNTQDRALFQLFTPGALGLTR